jgi:hypothetical protein
MPRNSDRQCLIVVETQGEDVRLFRSFTTARLCGILVAHATSGSNPRQTVQLVVRTTSVTLTSSRVTGTIRSRLTCGTCSAVIPRTWPADARSQHCATFVLPRTAHAQHHYHLFRFLCLCLCPRSRPQPRPLSRSLRSLPRARRRRRSRGRRH